MTNKIQKILRLINYDFTGPLFSGLSPFTLKMVIEFEGFGVASEDWEEHWKLELPFVQAYWKGTNGWNPCNDGISYGNDCRSPEQCLDEAIEFLESVPQVKILQP